MSGTLRFEANCSILFTELPLLERFQAAAEAGFSAVELWWPFPVPVPDDAELDGLEEAVRGAGLDLVGLNLDAGNMAAGERGLVSLPGSGSRFSDNLECTVQFARRMGTPALNALYGNRVEGAAPEEQDELALERLAEAARAGDAEGVRILVETQNRVDSPHYPLTTAEQAVAVASQVRQSTGLSNVDWLCDLYHLAMEGQDLEGALEAHASWIGHVQVADSPGRHQPGTGTIDFVRALRRLVGLGYRGWVGCEYRPSGATKDSFGWREELTRRVESTGGPGEPAEGKVER